MSVLIRLEKLEKSLLAGRVVAAVIGFFDGVHLGHSKIIKMCIERAREINGISVVFTFDKPPVNIVSGRLYKKLITSYPDKISLIKKIGPDYIVVARFDSSFASLEPAEFCRKILIEKLNIRELFIGKGFRFGRSTGGDTGFLKNFFKESGVKINEVPILNINGVAVSSTVIRDFYKNGDIESITAFLGRLPSIKGVVIKGDERGRLLGFPTANIDVFEKYVTPKDGVYIGYVHIFERKWKEKSCCSNTPVVSGKMSAVINIGNNPTFEGKRKWVESHIIDFDRDIYGKKIEVFFLKRLRNEITFKNKEELMDQIESDIENTKDHFKGLKNSNSASWLTINKL